MKSFNVPFTFKEGKVDLLFPNIDDDLVLRFLEWVWQPHKTRHINYVRNNLDSALVGTPGSTGEFMRVVNEYTNIEIDEEYIRDLLRRGPEGKVEYTNEEIVQ